MESNWRWNVFELGWHYGPFELMARVPGIGLQPTYVCKFIADVPVYQLLTLVAPPFTWSATNFPKPAAHPNFPYGVMVDPD